MHRPSISHTDLQSHTQTFNLTQNIHSLVYLTYTVWEVPQEQSPHEAHTYVHKPQYTDLASMKKCRQSPKLTSEVHSNSPALIEHY